MAALLGGEAELADVSDAIERLAARELVSRAATPEGRADAEFTFAHALVREAAYAMLTDDDRLLGHRLAGAWLEQAGAGDAMALAEHFRRGGEPARAVRWYERAAARGAARQRPRRRDRAGGDRDGQRRDRRGGGPAAPDPGGGARLARRAGRGPARARWRRRRRSRPAAARGCARRRRRSSRRPNTGGWTWSNARSPWSARRRARPIATARNAQVICLSWAANYLVFGGRTAAADALILRIAELAGDFAQIEPQALGLVHQVRAARASAAGDLGRCLGGLESALQAFEQAGDLRNACAVRTNLGYLYCELGDFQRAEAALRQALVASDRMGLYDLTAAVLQNLGRVLGQRGELAEAERLEREAIDDFGRQGDPRMEGAARTYLAEILIAGGDYAGAEREAAAAIATLAGAPSLQVAALGVSSRARLGRGDAEGALEAGARRARGAGTAGRDRGRGVDGPARVRRGASNSRARATTRAAALAVAHQRLLARAERIEEPAWRTRFLHAVPVNARILALAEEWRAPSAARSRAGRDGGAGAASGTRTRDGARPTGSNALV